MPSHIQPTRNARLTTSSSARGEKSRTSPMHFMACVTQISPPVPEKTTMARMNSVRIANSTAWCEAVYDLPPSRPHKSESRLPSPLGKLLHLKLHTPET